MRLKTNFSEAKAQELCSNLLKVNETERHIYITLDVPRSGLDLSYDEICYCMEKFFSRITFFSDVVNDRCFSKIELKDNVIILRKFLKYSI